jgi:hypothetical protein
MNAKNANLGIEIGFIVIALLDERNTRSLAATQALCPSPPKPGANGSPPVRPSFTRLGMTYFEEFIER